MKAIIRKNIKEAMFGEPERVETIDITACQDLIKQLQRMSNIVNEFPGRYDEMSKAMSFCIENIKRGISIK